MEEIGRVVSIDDGKMVIEVCAAEACSKCCSCGASGVRTMVVDVLEDKDFKVGDNVKIRMENAVLMRMNILLYLVPLIVFAGVTLTVHELSNDPGKSFLAGCVSTGLAYFLISKIIRSDERFAPEIIKNGE